MVFGGGLATLSNEINSTSTPTRGSTLAITCVIAFAVPGTNTVPAVLTEYGKMYSVPSDVMVFMSVL